MFALTTHNGFVQQIFMRAVHGMEGLVPGDKAGAQFQGGEMSSEQDHTLATRHRLLQMLDAFNTRQPIQLLVWCPPGHGGFKEADTQRGEMFFQ